MKLSEIIAAGIEKAPPREVWKAVEGDRTELVALLRSERKLGRRTRDALADWLEGSLKPLELPKGRPPETIRRISVIDGHDLATKLGGAGYSYDRLRLFIKKKGWHLKKAGRFYWSAERLMEAVAESREIELEAFRNYMSRSKPKGGVKPETSEEYEERMRLAYALEIRRKKMSPKG